MGPRQQAGTVDNDDDDDDGRDAAARGERGGERAQIFASRRASGKVKRLVGRDADWRGLRGSSACDRPPSLTCPLSGFVVPRLRFAPRPAHSAFAFAVLLLLLLCCLCTSAPLHPFVRVPVLLHMALDAQKPMGRVVLLDGSMVRSFAEDQAAFNLAVDPLFHELDVNADGVLSRTELRPAFERLNLIDLHFGVPDTKTPAELTALYDSVFEDFDTDHNNTVDLNEFRSSLNQILLAIADGLGSAPLTMVVEDGSLLGNAADHETHDCRKP